ncbi:hypothetical protein [Photobacterium phosphoreum]|uniref:hypothetical protein n=1 Tax=Photobacterium phosphoreum TaxID=659 RepID=UPI0011B27AA1|nr:hypothetical protein [Photobacterium phosphoreum]MCD9510947.1 hypothetical protein [Photobacterium phosphoreum]
MSKKILIVLICNFFVSNCFAKTEFTLDFLLQADVTPSAAGFKVKSVAISPNNFTVIYDESQERFHDINSTLTVNTDIPSDRAESFYYDINLVENNASCLLHNGKTIYYEPPVLAITNNMGDLVEVNSRNPLLWQEFDDVVSGTQASVKKINLSFSKIPVTDFINNYKYCEGKMTLMVGLSI